MNIKLTRKRIRVNTGSNHFDNTCEGILTIEGKQVCDTAENAKYRIPPGTYTIKLQRHKSWGRKMPTLISPLSARTSPILAIGNGIHATHDGSILVGKQVVPGVVIRSRDIFLNLYDRINNSLRRGNKVSITITE